MVSGMSPKSVLLVVQFLYHGHSLTVSQSYVNHRCKVNPQFSDKTYVCIRFRIYKCLLDLIRKLLNQSNRKTYLY